MKIEELKESISPLPYKAEFVSTVQGVHGQKVDMYRINGEGKTLCTLGMPHGEKAQAQYLAHAANNFFPLLEALEGCFEALRFLRGCMDEEDKKYEEMFSRASEALEQAQEVG